MCMRIIQLLNNTCLAGHSLISIASPCLKLSARSFNMSNEFVWKLNTWKLNANNVYNSLNFIIIKTSHKTIKCIKNMFEQA